MLLPAAIFGDGGVAAEEATVDGCNCAGKRFDALRPEEVGRRARLNVLNFTFCSEEHGERDGGLRVEFRHCFHEIQMKYCRIMSHGGSWWVHLLGGRRGRMERGGLRGRFFAGLGWFVSFMVSELAQIVRASANRQTGTVNWTPTVSPLIVSAFGNIEYKLRTGVA